MTNYTIDLLNPQSFSRLPSAEEVIQICLSISADILEFMSNILTVNNFQDIRTITNQQVILKGCLGRLAEAIPNTPGIPSSITIISVHVEQHGFRNPNSYLKQLFTMDTLSGVHHIILIEILSKLLESSLEWITTNVTSYPVFLVAECTTKIRIMINKLFSIFVHLIMIPRPNLAMAKIQIEIMDQNGLPH
jgi:hypothetical protein